MICILYQGVKTAILHVQQFQNTAYLLLIMTSDGGRLRLNDFSSKVRVSRHNLCYKLCLNVNRVSNQMLYITNFWCIACSVGTMFTCWKKGIHAIVHWVDCYTFLLQMQMHNFSSNKKCYTTCYTHFAPNVTKCSAA